MKAKDKDYVDITETIRTIRKINEGKEKEESEENKGDAVPYTMQDEIMANITQTAKAQFGADFSKSKTPMLYYPDDGDVVLSGVIGDLNDAKFQFRYKDASGNGCYLFTSPVQLTDETLKKMNVILGVFKNWKKDLSSLEDIKPIGYRG